MNGVWLTGIVLWFTTMLGAQASHGDPPRTYPECLQHALELGRESAELRPRSDFDIAFSFDGSLLIVGMMDSVWSTVLAFDTASGKQLWRADVGSEPTMVRLSPDGRMLAIGYASYTVCEQPHLELRNARTGARMEIEDRGSLSSLKRDSVTGIGFSGDGKFLAAQVGYVIRVWDVASGGNRFSFMTPFDDDSDDNRPPRIYSLSFTADSKSLAGAGPDHKIFLWRVRDGKLTRGFHVRADSDGYGAIEFSPDGKLLAAEAFGPIRVWRVDDGALVGSFSTGEREFLLGFNKDGKTLITSSDSNEGQVETWDMRQPRRKRPLFSLQVPEGGTYLLRSTGHIMCASFIDPWIGPRDSMSLKLSDLDTGKTLSTATLPGRAKEPWMNQGEPRHPSGAE